jgi:hypothetical protein
MPAADELINALNAVANEHPTVYLHVRNLTQAISGLSHELQDLTNRVSALEWEQRRIKIALQAR